MDHGLLRRDIEMQVLVVTPPEGTQLGPQRCPCPFAAVAMDLTPAIPSVIPRPFAHSVANGGMARMTPPRALPLISREPRAPGGAGVRHAGAAGVPVRVVANPPALRARVA